MGVGRQLSSAFGKILKAHGQDNVPQDIWRGVGLGAQGISALPFTPLSSVLGIQGPWRWCPELFDDSGVDAVLPLSNLKLDPPSSQPGTAREMNVFRGGKGREDQQCQISLQLGGQDVRSEWRNRDAEWGGGSAGAGACGGQWGQSWGC